MAADIGKGRAQRGWAADPPKWTWNYPRININECISSGFSKIRVTVDYDNSSRLEAYMM